MTREEHVAAAEAVARDNPGWSWRWKDRTLLHAEGSATVYIPTLRGGYWEAYRPGQYKPVGNVSRFRSPAAALRAMGFTLATDTSHAR